MKDKHNGNKNKITDNSNPNQNKTMNSKVIRETKGKYLKEMISSKMETGRRREV